MSDIWSLGLVLIECATEEFPYRETRAHREMVQTILDSAEPNVDDSYTPEFRDFLGHCLKKQAGDRLPADILLESPWLEQNGAINIDTATATVEEWARERPLCQASVFKEMPVKRQGNAISKKDAGAAK